MEIKILTTAQRPERARLKDTLQNHQDGASKAFKRLPLSSEASSHLISLIHTHTHTLWTHLPLLSRPSKGCCRAVWRVEGRFCGVLVELD